MYYDITIRGVYSVNQKFLWGGGVQSIMKRTPLFAILHCHSEEQLTSR